MTSEQAAAGRDGAVSAAVAQVLRADGGVAGVGFLAAEGVVVTCAHVVGDAGVAAGGGLRLRFPHVEGAPGVQGEVVAEAWRDPDGEDVAVVRLPATPPGAQVLALGSAADCRGHRVRSFGFPAQAPPDGHYGYGMAGDLLPGTAGAGALLQLTGANDLTQGFSGAPVVDEVTGLVVGMVTAITAPDDHRRGLSIAYATPPATLRQVWPDLNVGDVYPYRGLEPFTVEDASWFHGRDDAVERLLAGLAAHRLLLLLGPSGAGKSSLVQAGVLPALAAGRVAGGDRWLPVVARPGQDLMAELDRAGLPGASDGIVAAAGRRLAGEPTSERLLLVIDQFEELLTQTGSAQRPSDAQVTAVEQLTAAAGSPAPLTVVLVMRDDFYPRLAALAPQLLEAAAPGLLNVPATLSTQDLHAIITRPAETAGAHFEHGLAERITSDVLAVDHDTTPARQAPVTVLPLLELTLSQLWRDRRDGHLTHDAYQRIGEVTGGLATWSDTALNQLPARLRPAARQMLTALVRPADEAHHVPAVRQQVPLSVLRDLAAGTGTDTRDGPQDGEPAGHATADEVLAALTRYRIVTTRTVGTGEPSDTGEPVAELVHDALIHDWGTLRTWVDQDHQFQDWLRRAREQYVRWTDRRDPGDLLHGTELSEGLDWSRQRRLPGDIAELLAASHLRQRATARRARRLNAILATLLVVALAAAGLALVQRQSAVTAERNARDAQQVAVSRQLAARSDALLTTDPDLASLLAIQAYRTSTPPTAEATASLYAAAALPLQRTLPGETVAFSPDGNTVATTSGDQAAVWDSTTGELQTVLTDPVGDESTPDAPLAFSPDGRTVADAKHDGTLQLWDLTTGELRATLTGPPNDIGWLNPPPAFSPDGNTLAAANLDGTVQLWNVISGEVRTTLTVHGRNSRTYIVQPLVFSPDGNTLATATSDAKVRLWDVATGETRTTLTGTDSVDSVAFSPDGNTLAMTTRTEDGVMVRRWDIASGETQATRIGLNDLGTEVESATLSPNLRALAIGGTDGSVRLFDVATGVILATLPGFPNSTTFMLQQPPVFSSDGTTLATTVTDESVIDADGTFREENVVRLWDIPIGTPLDGQSSFFSAVTFGRDGVTLASISFTASEDDPTEFDATAALWDTTTREPIHHNLPRLPPSGGDPGGWSVGVGRDHNILATTTDGTVELWDIATGEPINHGITSDVASLGFSPDGATLATTRSQGQVDLWDIATREHRSTLRLPPDRAEGPPPDRPPVISADGNTLAAISEESGTVWTWDLPTGEPQPPIVTGGDSNTAGVALSPDGSTLATTSFDGTVQLWDPTTGEPLITLPGHTGVVLSAAFGPDGTTLATAGQDRAVRLWDTSTGRTLTTFGHTDWVTSLAFSPDGTILATAIADGDSLTQANAPIAPSTVQLWNVPSFADPADAIRKICQAAPPVGDRNLTPQEQAQYLPQDQEYNPACSPAPLTLLSPNPSDDVATGMDNLTRATQNHGLKHARQLAQTLRYVGHQDATKALGNG